jgi:hypothetical protein
MTRDTSDAEYVIKQCAPIDRDWLIRHIQHRNKRHLDENAMDQEGISISLVPEEQHEGEESG